MDDGPALAAAALEAAGAPAPEPAPLAAPLAAVVYPPPIVDTTAIPIGSPGVDVVQLERTTELPVPSEYTGAFRTVCDFSHMNFDDPINYPRQPGRSHLHAYFGNTDVDAFTTAETLASTGNSTCRGGIVNRTGYWVPAVVDARGRPVRPRSLDTYYKSGYYGITASEVRVFPEGLRMVAGDMTASGPQTYAYWGCRGKYVGKPGFIPNSCDREGITMTVEFPQCWDGRNLDSADHKSHMSYPVDGDCPATHPVAIPLITMIVVYDTPSRGTRGWRLVSDAYDPSLRGGYSAHADWFDGWDPAIASTFVRRCINPSLDCHSHLLGDGRAMY